MTPLYTRLEKVQPKLHGLAAGMTLSVGSLMLNQGCPMVGQCASCGGACAPQLSLLVLPILADGVVLFTSKMMKKAAEAK